MMIGRTLNDYCGFWQELYRDYEHVDNNTKGVLMPFLGGEMTLGYPELLEIPVRANRPCLHQCSGDL